MHARRLGCVVILAVLMAFAPATAAESAKAKILLVHTRPDHAWATHMYEFECKLLARCLQQTKGVETVVVRDWPTDARELEGVKAIVYYSRPAGDIVLAPAHKKKFQELMKDGVGFVAIHWATA